MFFLLAVILILTLIYYYLIKPLTYWRDNGVIQEDIYSAFKFSWFFMAGHTTLVDIMTALYTKFPGHRYYGTYQFNFPSLIVKDIDMVKQITIKDFEHFGEHRDVASEDPLWSINLFALKGMKWRRMRSILSPSFTGSKMKIMLNLIKENAQKLSDYFLDQKKDIVEIEIGDVATRYCTDVIASTAFGLDVHSLADPRNEFYQKGWKLANLKEFNKMARFVVNIFFPKIAKIFNIRIVNIDVGEFFQNIIDETIKFREERGIERPDMIQMLLEGRKKLNNNEKVNGKSDIDNEDQSSEEITNRDILAQALVFFFAGFDTSSGFISMMTYELCANPEIQEKLRQEVLETDKKCPNGLTYEALMDMKYMDMVTSETLRKWPIMPVVERLCTKAITIPPVLPHEKPLHIREGELITIVPYGLHNDPQYFPNPQAFDPERFSEENKGNIKPCTYMPFGLGPRNCIGARFAIMETKLLFFYLLKNFKIVPTKKTVIPIVLNETSLSFVAKNGFHIGLQRV